jgi:hypothetical protein
MLYIKPKERIPEQLGSVVKHFIKFIFPPMGMSTMGP